MGKLVIGYLYSGKDFGQDEILFKNIAKKKNVEPILISTTEWSDEKKLREKIKSCDIIYNSSAEDFAIETEKTIEEFGKKIIEPSKAYYYTEDKWMFYLKCSEHKIAVPKTILLSENIPASKKSLKEFNQWPVILKRVTGTMGQFVEKADDLEEAGKIMKKLWEKSSERLPIIAQEYIHSPSYRVTVFGNEIVQTAIKRNRGWKATGVYSNRIRRFPVDKELKEIVDRMMKFVKINVCGIDFLMKDGKWIALEVNSAPALSFFERDRRKMVNILVEFLIKLAKRK
ncbi:MAG: ATP-grasp domain-containing protein [Nanoarchaeota archaeon]